MEKEKYSLASNVSYLLKVALEEKCGDFLAFLTGMTGLMIAAGLLYIYSVPWMIQSIITGQSFGKVVGLISAIGLANLAVDTLYSYFERRITIGRIHVRIHLLNRMNLKYMGMSYPLAYKKELRQLREKVQKAMNNNHTGIEHIWENMARVIAGIILATIYIIVLSVLPIPLVLVIIGKPIVSFFGGKKLRQWRQDNRQTEGKYAKRLNYLDKTASDHKNVKEIAMFGLSNWLEEIYQKNIQAYEDFLSKATRKVILADMIEVLLTVFCQGFAYYYLITAVLQNQMDVATFLVCFGAQAKLAVDMQQLLNSIHAIYQTHGNISSLRQVLDYPERFRLHDGPVMAKEELREIEFRKVSFRYEESEETILENINVTIRKGDKIAIVGRNGAGKTTFIKLLCGLLDPSEGEILVNGVNLKEWNRSKYYALIAAVFQENSLFAGTLEENIANTTTAIHSQKVRNAVKLSGFAEKVDALPSGVSTYIGKEVYDEAIELSGGELQKLLLARAIYREAPILVLDEPTAALDPIAEQEIYQKYNALSQGAMSLFISHRLASTRFCDCILLIENKGIAEKGTHQELMQMGGRYQELFEIQSRYYREENCYEKDNFV